MTKWMRATPLATVIALGACAVPGKSWTHLTRVEPTAANCARFFPSSAPGADPGARIAPPSGRAAADFAAMARNDAARSHAAETVAQGAQPPAGVSPPASADGSAATVAPQASSVWGSLANSQDAVAENFATQAREDEIARRSASTDVGGAHSGAAHGPDAASCKAAGFGPK